MMELPLLALMMDHTNAPSNVVSVSVDINTLIHCATLEDLSKDMRPLREIGETVEILKGEAEMRIEETKLL